MLKKLVWVDLHVWHDFILHIFLPRSRMQQVFWWWYLRQLHSIWRSVRTSLYQTLVVALVLSRLDYGNAVLVGLPGYLYNCLLNAAARSIAGLRRSDHITDKLANFHWLKAPDSRVSITERHSTILPGCPLVAVCNCWRSNFHHCWFLVVEQLANRHCCMWHTSTVPPRTTAILL